ncbi:hypothetical protein [Pseudomonas sp. CFBP 13602]|uniref:hypothetical protein n=1 Tax=Pseudomonas sp. CFBP 13602 TaxID=2774039 RepID=UPI00177E60E6|nr:hypothetical protein [Pseudomonas sp. CFBP 13602]MBD8828982.1 hypothetical protein [Pseudomonas sp. CFBP 13602]
MGAAVTAAQVNSGLHINLPRSFLLRLENTLPLTLELKVGMGKSVSESEAVTFPEGVLSITQLALMLPAPIVENEANGHLDPAVIPGTGVKITTPAYGGIEAGQWVGLEWTAVDPAGSLILPARRLTTAQPLEFTVPKAVAELSRDKAVSVAYTVARVENGLVKTSEAVQFELSKIKPAPPVKEGFDNAPIGFIERRLELDEFAIESNSFSRAFITQNPPIAFQPYITGNALQFYSATKGASIVLRPKHSCIAIEFGVTAPDGFLSLTIYYGSQGRKNMTVRPGWARIDVRDNPTMRISEVQIFEGGGIHYLDNVLIEYDSEF